MNVAVDVPAGFGLRLSDEVLEQLIESYRVIGTYEPDGELRREAFKRMGELVEQRSPAQVARMERERGLRAS